MVCRFARAQFMAARIAPRYFYPTSESIGAQASSQSRSSIL
jgi:hypothetical protein